MTGGEIFNLVLGACALWYSFMPPHLVRGYRRSIALLMRFAGALLIFLTGASMLLKLLGRGAH